MIPDIQGIDQPAVKDNLNICSVTESSIQYDPVDGEVIQDLLILVFLAPDVNGPMKPIFIFKKKGAWLSTGCEGYRPSR
jgi:hypothetical protein